MRIYRDDGILSQVLLIITGDGFAGTRFGFIDHARKSASPKRTRWIACCSTHAYVCTVLSSTGLDCTMGGQRSSHFDRIYLTVSERMGDLCPHESAHGDAVQTTRNSQPIHSIAVECSMTSV
jgi:hypothetical protein